MLPRYQALIILLFFLVGLQAQEKKKSFKESLKSSLVVELDASYEFKNKSLQKTELIVKPEFSYRFNKNSRLVLKGQLYTELNDNLEAGVPEENTVSGFSKRLFIGNRTNLELREFYFYTKIQKKIAFNHW